MERIPKHLSPASAAWFAKIASEFELGDDHHRILQLACESWDLLQEARTILAAEGCITTSETGVRKSHPAVAVLNSASDRFLKAVSLLGLGSEASPAEVPGSRKHVRIVKP